MQTTTSIRPHRPRFDESRNGLLHLGWRHYWVLVAILGGLLGLIATALLMHQAPF